jgi:hypothetical protein
VTLPTFSDSTTTRSPTSTIVDLLWMVTKPGHPSVPKTAGSPQDRKRWRSLWASVDGALVERMGLSMVRQLGLHSGVAMEVTGRCAETFRLRSGALCVLARLARGRQPNRNDPLRCRGR